MSKKRYKRQEAVALTYLPDQNDAPKVTAKGKARIAEKYWRKPKNMVWRFKKILPSVNCWDK